MLRTTRVRAGQLIVAEVALAAAVGAAFGPGWVFLGVVALTAAVLLATFGRAGGRWWYEAVASQHRFRRRRRLAAARVVAAAVGGGSDPPHLPWLRTLAPTLTIRPVTVGAATVGVGADHDGWFAAVEVGSLWDDDPIVASDGEATIESPWAPGAVARLPAGPVPYPELAALTKAGPDRAGVSCVQVVIVAGASIGEPRPAWVAVRVSPRDALAAERSGGLAAVERTVAAAALRAARTLDGHGWPAHTVDSDRLHGVLAEAVGLDGPPQEHWSVWRSGRLARTHYELTGWTAPRGTVAVGITQVAVSFTAHGEPGVLAVVAALPSALGRICREVVRTCGDVGVRLRRLDGEHALAAYAMAPTAALPANSASRATRETVR